MKHEYHHQVPLGIAKFSGGWRQAESPGLGGPLEACPDRGRAMSSKVTIEVDARHEGFVRRALALADGMEQLALTAPYGTMVERRQTPWDGGPDRMSSEHIREALCEALPVSAEAKEAVVRSSPHLDHVRKPRV